MHKYKATYNQYQLLFIMPTQDDTARPNAIFEISPEERYAIFEAETDQKAYQFAIALLDNYYHQSGVVYPMANA